MSDNITYCENCRQQFSQLSSHRGADICWDCRHGTDEENNERKQAAEEYSAYQDQRLLEQTSPNMLAFKKLLIRVKKLEQQVQIINSTKHEE